MKPEGNSVCITSGDVVVNEGQLEQFKQILGLEKEPRETIDKSHVTNVFLKCGGSTEIHFMISHKEFLKNFNYRGEGTNISPFVYGISLKRRRNCRGKDL